MPGGTLVGRKADLLGLGEEIVDIAVERQPPDDPDGHVLLGDELGRIEHVIGLRRGKVLVEDLDAEVPLPGSRRARSPRTGRGGGNRGRRRRS